MHYFQSNTEGELLNKIHEVGFTFDAIIDGKKAYETRGKWEVKNDFMAGPFLNYTVKDITTIMNFVYGKINDPETEIHYTIEMKKANGKNHIVYHPLKTGEKKSSPENIYNKEL